jgi:hypothetical protein
MPICARRTCRRAHIAARRAGRCRHRQVWFGGNHWLHSDQGRADAGHRVARNTAFAKPAAHIQPEGNITLVTLPTYFAATWPQAGFQPGEIDTVTLIPETATVTGPIQPVTVKTARSHLVAR